MTITTAPSGWWIRRAKMLIREMFVKPIDRDIKGVIKVGQADEENIRQELEEYVVTRELRTHFRDFFSSYRRGLSGQTDKMGVWISGFFGSGKSHFLKILSYLLENKEVDGKKALNYFTDDQKIDDSLVLADMKLAGGTPTDVILFNIDSKSEDDGKHDKEAIVSVFLKVFNEMQGFYGSNPDLADLERQLSETNRYEDFKTSFEAITGRSWEASRNKFDFIQDYVVDTLVDIDFMGREAASNWCEKAMQQTYQISIENFANRVKDYLDKKGNDHQLVFLVDEMGQYVGDDSKLMLNLQTVTEDLGTICQGRVWIIVTSQQDIDTVTQTKGNDFSKIQGRFDIRLALSSANVDEVIKKRILEKTPTAEQTLRLLYEQKSTVIKNLLVFDDAVEKKLYADEHDFALVYPFIPYQFNLLASVLTSIRTHGASGKHLSEGERSMLALFKESAMTLMDKEHGVLVPFNIFYDALHQFLDHSHKGVISKAADNQIINPNKEENCFNVNVLKTLFMIKYVQEISSTVENITSLMVSNIDTERIALKKQVQNALDILVQQMLVQKNGNIYVFLTDEEQEINREIEKIGVEMAEVIGKTSELIFDDLFDESSYRHPEHRGRYIFPFNQKVDDRSHKQRQNHDISVHVLTPNYDNSTDDITLRMMSEQNKEVIVVLPDDSAFLDELRSSIKIERYLRLNTTTHRIAKFAQIREAKQVELRHRNSDARLFLSEALENADVFVNGHKIENASRNISAKINDALSKLVSTVYHKLSYIDTPVREEHIRQLFQPSRQAAVTVEGERVANELALHDVLSFISDNTHKHEMTSMKRVLDRFSRAPYGFEDEDIEWLVAILFKEGELAFEVSGDLVTLVNKRPEEIIRYITKKDYREKLLMERRQQASEAEKRAVRDIIRDLYLDFRVQMDDDTLMETFKNHSKDRLDELEKLEIHYETHRFPGKEVIKRGKDLLRPIFNIQAPTEFFTKIVDEAEALRQFADAYEPVKAFFSGDQRRIYQEAFQLITIYDESKIYIVDDQVETTAHAMRSILQSDSPYGDIHKLPDLISKFRSAYAAALDIIQGPVLKAIESARSRVLDELESKTFYDDHKDDYFRRFQELSDRAKSCNNVATLKSIEHQADALKIRLLGEILQMSHMVADKVAQAGETISKPSKIYRPISIHWVNPSPSWQIETEDELDQYLEKLRQQILSELSTGTVITIEF